MPRGYSDEFSWKPPVNAGFVFLFVMVTCGMFGASRFDIEQIMWLSLMTAQTIGFKDLMYMGYAWEGRRVDVSSKRTVGRNRNVEAQLNWFCQGGRWYTEPSQLS
ncbi:hypothetical protein ONS95_014171 [Cadophora gregata]|uniref:uncharacterized protein n=1 Tax=Cadophora gregata TaxID=51156 RepID=UPI0026DAE6DF|nr:uncharacterized protein ONS95_014171 [Cadophora gregata]KAK0113940.1 hypothetical protein ONS96_014789 [Cadophora gregata f. sp. sojae]KAK0114686.1 hypothetical protein ONS95_014171 [Cadophora gregata]